MGVKINAVCAKCNEGWMHDLETEAEPILTPLIRDGTPVTLTVEDQRLMSTWGIKTAMVFEFTCKDPPYYTQYERDLLRRTRAPFSNWSIVWLGRYVGSHMCTGFGMQITYGLQVGNDVVQVHGHYSTITLGQFCIQVLSLRPPDWILGFNIKMEHEWASRTINILPAAGIVKWPIWNGIDDEWHERLLQRFYGPEVTPSFFYRPVTPS
jgi:hypothetical protein